MGEALLGWDRNVVMRSPPGEKRGGAEVKERSHPFNKTGGSIFWNILIYLTCKKTHYTLLIEKRRTLMTKQTAMFI